MSYQVVAVVALLAGLGVFWPAIAKLLSKLKGAVTSVTPTLGGGPISRDAAVAGLLAARDFAHAEGRHEVCKVLDSCFPGLLGEEHDDKERIKL